MYAFGPEVRVYSALWVAAAWLLLGYWGARSSSGSRAAFVLAATAVTLCLGLGAVPIGLGLPVAHTSEWLAAIAGFAVGWVVARPLRRA
jgi:hypothetical protein